MAAASCPPGGLSIEKFRCRPSKVTPKLYRVQYPGTQARRDDNGDLRSVGNQNFHSLKNYNKESLKTILENNLEWRCREPSPFINVFDNITKARCWARNRSRKFRVTCEILEIDTAPLVAQGRWIGRLASICKDLDIDLDTPKLKADKKYAYLVLYNIPDEAITSLGLVQCSGPRRIRLRKGCTSSSRASSSDSEHDTEPTDQGSLNPATLSGPDHHNASQPSAEGSTRGGRRRPICRWLHTEKNICKRIGICELVDVISNTTAEEADPPAVSISDGSITPDDQSEIFRDSTDEGHTEGDKSSSRTTASPDPGQECDIEFSEVAAPESTLAGLTDPALEDEDLEWVTLESLEEDVARPQFLDLSEKNYRNWAGSNINSFYCS